MNDSTRWAAIAAFLVLALAACATRPPGSLPIDARHRSANQDSRVQFLIIHYTVDDMALALAKLTEPRYEVSAHYLISDDPEPVVYQLVPEERRAWHSGPSYWQGQGMLNAASIGIEVVHPGFRLLPDGTREYLPFPPAQIDALIRLARDIVERHGIRPDRILGHGEVLAQDKQDPGPTFPWRRLAEAGLVPWPDAGRVAAQRAVFEQALPDLRWFQERLGSHGFAVPGSGELDAETRNVLVAFQMRYRPRLYDGTPDAETAAILQVLTTPATAASR
jgi:N-acetylmuramoyl-L-alanine amidase